MEPPIVHRGDLAPHKRSRLWWCAWRKRTGIGALASETDRPEVRWNRPSCTGATSHRTRDRGFGGAHGGREPGLVPWHRKLIAQKYDGTAHRAPGRPRTAQEIEALVVRMAEENRDWCLGIGN